MFTSRFDRLDPTRCRVRFHGVESDQRIAEIADNSRNKSTFFQKELCWGVDSLHFNLSVGWIFKFWPAVSIDWNWKTTPLQIVYLRHFLFPFILIQSGNADRWIEFIDPSIRSCIHSFGFFEIKFQITKKNAMDVGFNWIISDRDWRFW